MKKLFLLLILTLFSAQGLTGGCPDGSDPVKSVSADGTYFVYKCGGSATSSSETTQTTSTPAKAKVVELEMFSRFVGQFDMKKLSENSNPNVSAFSPITDKFDINQDGHDDFIVGNTTLNTDQRNLPNEFSKPVLLFWDNNIQEYVVDIEVQKALPLLYFPRRIHGSINPKTGLTHLFIADTGLDLANYDFSKGSANLPPNCGAQNHLITYDPSSKKVTKIQLPKLWDYTHALATADLNGDQITDYVVLNSPYIKYPQKCLFNGADYTNGSYILYSNKNGGFDKVNIELNYKGYSKTPTITSGVVIVDDNNDTFLILGSEDPGDSIYALKQDSKGSFTETSKVSAPAIMRTNGKSGAYSEVLYADVNADGTKEVVASIATTDWEGRYIQLLDFNNGELRDRSEDVVQSASNAITGRDWCHHLFFNEQTSWGQPILTCTHLFAISESRGYFYTWTENKLQLAKIKSTNKEAWEKEILEKWIREIFPMTIDQKNVFVGQELTGERKVNGHSFYDVKVFNLIEPPEPPKKRLAPSNAFDGNYVFKLTVTDPDGHSWAPGGGLIEIKNGILNVSNKGRTLKDVDSSTDKFDTFEGQIDKNSDFTGTFEFNACGPGDCEEELIVLEGNINNDNKLSGSFLNKIIAFELTKMISKEETSSAFDGSYSFVLSGMDAGGMLAFGYGTLNIKNGIASISKNSQGMAKPKYQSFEGRVDKNGDLTASFSFNPCPHCDWMEDKSIVFEGNIDKLKLSGMYDDIKIYFYLKKIKAPETKTTTVSSETTKVETSDSDPTVSKVIEVIHGDKFIVNIAEPHELAGSNINVSLRDIDAPDATKSCPKQLELGIEVRDFVSQKLENASSIKLTNFRKTNTKIIAHVIVDGIDLGDELIEKGYASKEYGYWKPYFCSSLTAFQAGDQYFMADNDKSIFWYERAMILDPDGSNNSKATYRLSELYSMTGDDDKSLDYLKQSASLGWMHAEEDLGIAYLTGDGVAKDTSKAKSWLKKAHEHGSTSAEDTYCSSLPSNKQNTCKF